MWKYGALTDHSEYMTRKVNSKYGIDLIVLNNRLYIHLEISAPSCCPNRRLIRKRRSRLVYFSSSHGHRFVCAWHFNGQVDKASLCGYHPNNIYGHIATGIDFKECLTLHANST